MKLFFQFCSSSKIVIGKTLFFIFFFAIGTTRATLTAQPGLAECGCTTTTTFDLDFADTTYASSLGPKPVVFSGLKIRIRKTFYADKDVIFDDCCIQLDPEANIYVTNLKTLTTQNCTFYGCGYRWNRIEVQQGTAIRATNTTFRDADYAIQFKPGFYNPNTVVENCHFLNNNVGIQVGEFQVGQYFPSFMPSSFTGNYFECTPASNPQILPSLISSGPWTLTSLFGIRIFDCQNAKVIGKNHFKGLYRGIIIQNYSRVIVDGSSFDSLEYGINAFDSRLTVQNCKFNHLEDYGVSAHNSSHLKVSSCSFGQISSIGIRYYSPPNAGTVEIFRDTFVNDQYYEDAAIVVERPMTPFTGLGIGTNKINSNIFTISTEKIHFDAILLNSNYGGKSYFEIKKNQIIGLEAWRTKGISVVGESYFPSGNIEIVENAISFPNINAGEFAHNWGIGVRNIVGQHNQIRNNNLKSSLVPIAGLQLPESKCSQMQCGICVDDSPGMSICSNTTDSTSRGFHLHGKLGFCNFTGNHIGHHMDGLLGFATGDLATAAIPNLRWHENTWIADSSAYLRNGARNEDKNGMSVTPNYKFIVDKNANPTFWPPKISPLSTNVSGTLDGWFREEPRNNQASTATSCTGGIIGDSDDIDSIRTTPTESLLISGSPTGLTGSELWDAQRNLARKLITHPTLHPTGSPEDVYLNNQSGSSAYQFAFVEAAFVESFNIPTSWAINIKSLEDQQDFWADSLYQLYRFNQSASVVQIGQNVSAKLDSINAAIHNLDTQIKNFGRTNQLALQPTIQSLQHTQVWESNLKTILSAANHSFLGDTLTETDLSSLRTIAAQCQQTGGESVISAANWLPVHELVSFLFCSPNNNCGTNLQEPEERSIKANKKAGFELRIEPNPANEQVTVYFDGEIEVAKWSVLNSSGLKVFEGKISHGGQTSVSFAANSLSPGFYFYNLQCTDGNQRTVRFVVVH